MSVKYQMDLELTKQEIIKFFKMLLWIQLLHEID
jgi:hypothetical protein